MVVTLTHTVLDHKKIPGTPRRGEDLIHEAKGIGPPTPWRGVPGDPVIRILDLAG
jgi:hypothetical protein